MVLTKNEISGKYLRWIVCLLLRDTSAALTVAEIVSAVEERGYTIAGRAGKTVSDALRWEVGRGRVLQLKRGQYTAGRMQRSTEYSMRRRVAALRFSLNLPLGPGGAYGAAAPSLVATSAAKTAASTAVRASPESVVATSAAEFDSDAFEEMLLAAIEAEPVVASPSSFDVEGLLRPGERGEAER